MTRRINIALLFAASILFYFGAQQSNPPGFYSDECSIAYNALTIARQGVDEWGVRFPLYFKAFGEYKNPTFVYLLAGVFKVLPPSTLVARRVAAFCGYAACIALAALAWRVTRSRFITVVTFLSALLTPMLFEISRLVFEVALYPLCVGLFLLALRRAHERERWSAGGVAAIASTLLLLEYTYSIGRLLAPLLAGGLFIFYTRERRNHIAAILLLFIALGILPVALYNRSHQNGLMGRFAQLSYVDRSKPLATIVTFEHHFAANIMPLGVSLLGDPNTRHHVAQSGGSILLMTLALGAAGAIIGVRRRPGDRWTWFLIFGTVASLLPVSLTNDFLHTLRMSAYPVFLIALSFPALEYLRARPALLFAVLACGAMQAAWFVWRFETTGAARGPEFAFGARYVVREALTRPQRPIHSFDVEYIYALWFGALEGVEHSAFTRDPPSRSGDLTITTHAPPPGAVVVSKHGVFYAYELR